MSKIIDRIATAVAKRIVKGASSIYNNRGTNQQTSNYRPFFPTDPNFMASIEVDEAQQRAAGLYYENPVAAGIVNAMVDGAIGIGLQVQSYAKSRILETIGVTPEQIAETQRLIETYWNLWTNNPELCDHYHRQTFGSLQREAYINASVNGDMIQHIKIVRFGGIYFPQIQNISGAVLKSPNSADDKKIAAGVEVDASGRDIAYYIEVVDKNLMAGTIKRFPKYGERSKRLMYNLVMLGVTDPAQRRGRSVITRVAESIIQMKRYSEAELTKAILQSYLTLFIETAKDADADESINPITQLTESSNAFKAYNADGTEATTEGTFEHENQVTLGPGMVWELPAGKNANLPENKAPVAEFWSFMEAQLKLIGMAVGIPYEVLIKSFNASYSASQASIQDAARGWKIASQEWSYKYCQPVYEQFVELLVRQQLIDAPGFLDAPIYRKAWCASEWHGPAVLHVDPRKSVDASVLAIKYRLSSREIESRKLFGHEWEAVEQRLAEEEAIIAADGADPSIQEPQPQRNDDNPDDNKGDTK